MFNTIDEAIQDLKNGKVIIVCDDENRENEGDFIALAEQATPEIINFMVTHGRGLVCAPIKKAMAQRLELSPMVSKNTDSHETAFTVSVDHKLSTTGISAYERSATIQALINNESTASDFKRPGHVFPLIARDGGVLQRRGHTEAAVDLATLCGAKPAGVICEIMNEDGTMARVPQLNRIAEKFSISMVSIEDLVRYIKKKQENLNLGGIENGTII